MVVLCRGLARSGSEQLTAGRRERRRRVARAAVATAGSAQCDHDDHDDDEPDAASQQKPQLTRIELAERAGAPAGFLARTGHLTVAGNGGFAQAATLCRWGWRP